MAKKYDENNQNKNPVLIKPRQEVSRFLRQRIEIGNELLKLSISSIADLSSAYTQKEKWHKYNLEYLKHCFNIDSVAEEYDFSGATSFYINASFAQEIDSFIRSLRSLINELESIEERLSLFQEILTLVSKPIHEDLSGASKVFIVHGHDEALKHKVARYVQKMGLEGIILDEQPNVGMTVIEKFEHHAQDARYAIVLLTSDDIGYPKDLPEQARPRARQNAIAELGYFMKALGRKNIAILSSDEIEIPSDFSGILYLPIKTDAWELRLAKEMKAAGLDIDLNLL